MLKNRTVLASIVFAILCVTALIVKAPQVGASVRSLVSHQPALTDDMALKIVAFTAPIFSTSSPEELYGFVAAALVSEVQMDACADSWPEFRDVAEFGALTRMAFWRAGELMGLATPEVKAQVDVMQSTVNSYQTNGFASVGSQDDFEQCLVLSVVSRQMRDKLLAS